jgi:uncharacterized YccA/Bax inhibitor family protein
VPNPALNEKAFNNAVNTVAETQPGWGAPVPPSGDVASPWTPAKPTSVMTINGAATATAVLLVLLCATSVVAYAATTTSVATATGTRAVEIPWWSFAGMIGGIGFAIATIMRPQWARITAPLYALSQGLIVGAISKIYADQFDGIVLQAVMGTVAVLGVMLFLHVTRILKVTDKFRRTVIIATLAIAVVYVFDLIFSLFGANVPFIHETGGIGILVSVAIVVVAALNLSLDFDFIERATAARAPKQTEWYAAFGLLLTLVWLYLEMLRLLGKLQSR